MTIKRDLLLKRLIDAKHNDFVKIITGIRRCGKSYLLFNLFKRHLLKSGVRKDHIIEIDLENTSAKPLQNPIALLSHIKSQIKKDGRWTYVFIDEIQDCQKVLPPGTDLSLIHPDDRENAYVTFYSVLSELRRLLVDALDHWDGSSDPSSLGDCDHENRPHDPRRPRDPHPRYEYPYLYNIANHLAADFYGTKETTAYELKGGDGPLMQCRHCLQYAMGYCVKHGGQKPTYKSPLYLRLGDGRRFRLEFDCKHCQMNVFAASGLNNK